MGLDNKSAIVILIDTEGNFILQDRDNKPGIIDPGEIALFGGTVEQGESFEQAIVREIREELEIDIDIQKLKYFSDLEIPEESRLIKVFVCENIDAVGAKLNEGTGIVILSPTALKSMPRLGEKAEAVLREYLEPETN